MRYGIFDQVEHPAGVPLHELYRQHINLAVKAEEAGFWAYHKSEHHLIPLDGAPSINVYLAAVIEHTERIRVCSLVHALPFYHPIRLAEELAMLDHLSEGRLEVGYGKGISVPEHLLWGLPPDEANERSDEALDLILTAFQTEDDLDYEGRFWSFERMPIEVRPYQEPYPPLWRPGRLDVAADHGVSTVVGGPLPLVASSVARYRDRHNPDGIGRHHQPTVGGIRRIYVAPTDNEAEARARSSWAAFTDHLTRLFRRYEMTPPNNPTLGGDFDRALEVQAAIVGSPAKVRDHVEQFAEEAGTDYLVLAVSWGDLTGAEAERSLDLFAEHAMI